MAVCASIQRSCISAIFILWLLCVLNYALMTEHINYQLFFKRYISTSSLRFYCAICSNLSFWRRILSSKAFFYCARIYSLGISFYRFLRLYSARCLLMRYCTDSSVKFFMVYFLNFYLSTSE